MERETSDFLFSVLERFFEIPENEKQSAKRLATVQSLKPNEYLVRQGERWGQIGVVYKGIFRVFSIDMAGNERIINFRLKGDISGIYMPYFTDSGKDIWFSGPAHIVMHKQWARRAIIEFLCSHT
ncbi:cyclic nucleotide-binding domain-containing protein [Marispirochaeta sp.]|uniref:cyclic nucleotide-binding domain-containing protein n=1 Tax=Marispirochaeta sp. TaxID=2038653 RepID=UPI003748CAEE